MDDTGQLAWRYTGDLNWEPFGNGETALSQIAAE